MAKSLHPERETQNRIVKFFEKELGYKYLGNLGDEENFNIGWSRYFTKTGLLPIRCVKNEDVNNHSLPTQSSDVYY